MGWRCDFNNVLTGKEEMGWAVELTIDGLALLL